MSTGSSVRSLAMGHHSSSRWGVAAAAAAMWCGSFACLHLFWALGGSIGLASSAGRDLAGRRPASFVIFGLYGTAVLLGIGILTIAVTQSPRAARRSTSRGDRASGRCRGRTPVARSSAGGTSRHEHRRASRQCGPPGDALEPHPLEPVVHPRRSAVHRDCDTGPPVWAHAHPVAVEDRLSGQHPSQG